MLCPLCGADVGDEIKLCERCEHRRREREKLEMFEGEVEGGAQPPPPPPGEESTDVTRNFGQVQPAGFWLRSVAYLIDGSFALLLSHFFQQLLGALFGFSVEQFQHLSSTPSDLMAFAGVGLISLILFGVLGTLTVHFLYYALFESSPKQATPGKIILGLRVTDLDGERLSFAKASARYFACFASWITFGFGFVMAGFGERKQALHDRIAGTLVVRSSPRTTVELVAAFLGSLVLAAVCRTITESASNEKRINMLPSSTQTIEQQPPATRRDGGSITFDDRIESLKSTRVFWSADDSLLEVRFYPDAADAIKEASYLATLVIGIKPDESAVDKRLVTACFVRILDSGHEFEFPCEGGKSSDVGSASAINYLAGDVLSPNPVIGSVAGSGTISDAAGNTKRALRWSLDFNSVVRDRDQYDRENKTLSARNFLSSVALLDRTRSSLSIGLFPDEITDDDRALLRSENSLTALRDNQPVARFNVNLRSSKAATMQPEDTCAFQYLEFVDLAPISLSDATGCALAGELRDGAKLSGLLQGSASVSLEQFSGLLSWNFPLVAEVIDVDAASNQPVLSGEVSARGYVRAGEKMVEFQSAVALYSKKSGRLEIGYYPLALTDQDRAAIIHNRSFYTPVRDRRANLVLSVRFAPNTTFADVNRIIEANIYFARDVFGGFYFTGQSDRLSVARSRLQLTSGELRRFTGELHSGAFVEGLLKGESDISATGQHFAWKADFHVPITEIP